MDSAWIQHQGDHEMTMEMALVISLLFMSINSVNAQRKMVDGDPKMYGEVGKEFPIEIPIEYKDWGDQYEWYHAKGEGFIGLCWPQRTHNRTQMWMVGDFLIDDNCTLTVLSVKKAEQYILRVKLRNRFPMGNYTAKLELADYQHAELIVAPSVAGVPRSMNSSYSYFSSLILREEESVQVKVSVLNTKPPASIRCLIPGEDHRILCSPQVTNMLSNGYGNSTCNCIFKALKKLDGLHLVCESRGPKNQLWEENKSMIDVQTDVEKQPTAPSWTDITKWIQQTVVFIAAVVFIIVKVLLSWISNGKTREDLNQPIASIKTEEIPLTSSQAEQKDYEGQDIDRSQNAHRSSDSVPMQVSC